MTTLARRRHPLALAVTLALAAGSAQAATISVTDSGDSGTGSTCTLRQAIVSMNSQTLQAGCVNSGAGFGSNDTIQFDPTVTSVSLSGTQLSVTSGTSLTLQGSGQTIDANNNSRVLKVESATLTLSSLTLTGGRYNRGGGGGMYAFFSTVTLTDSTVSGNSAPFDERAAGHGGGVLAVHSTVTLADSTVSGNSAGYHGGGVYANSSTVTLTDSTVSGNSATLTAAACSPCPAR